MKLFLKKYFTKFLFLSAYFLLIPFKIYADSHTEATGKGCSGDKCTTLEPPIKGDIPTLIGNIIQASMGIVGSLALVMFIYGGFTWMMAAGNSEKVTKGKNVMIWAAAGLIVIFSAYALIRFIFTAIGVPGGP